MEDTAAKLWFDVEDIRYTTPVFESMSMVWLWFDVEDIRYTTRPRSLYRMTELWFDVEDIRYTTEVAVGAEGVGCGLM